MIRALVNTNCYFYSSSAVYFQLNANIVSSMSPSENQQRVQVNKAFDHGEARRKMDRFRLTVGVSHVEGCQAIQVRGKVRVRREINRF